MASHLRGSCTCGRNNYAVIIPSEATARQELEIFFDDHTENAYLRVPLSRYQSFTTAFYPDETHSSIRRIFTPQNAPHSQQIFCGLCGTHISHWSESPATESQFLNIALSTMKSRDLGRLEDLGIIRPEVDEAVDADVYSPADNAHPDQHPTANPSTSGPEQGPISMTSNTPASSSSPSFITQGSSGGLRWIQAARSAGGLKTRRGIGRSSDGKTVVEWEVSEFTDDALPSSSQPMAVGTGGKRKLGEDRAME